MYKKRPQNYRSNAKFSRLMGGLCPPDPPAGCGPCTPPGAWAAPGPLHNAATFRLRGYCACWLFSRFHTGPTERTWTTVSLTCVGSYACVYTRGGAHGRRVSTFRLGKTQIFIVLRRDGIRTQSCQGIHWISRLTLYQLSNRVPLYCRTLKTYSRLISARIPITLVRPRPGYSTVAQWVET